MKSRFKIFALLLLMFGSQSVWAQRQADNWFFGNRAALEFSGTTPTSPYSSAMAAPEGSASISDKFGNLLFYTDGQTIWDRLHQPMANGTGLLGSNGSTQSALIVPKPGNDSLFYVFTSDQNLAGNSANGIRYSIVNINANFSLGEVMAGSKNIALTGPGSISEKLAGIHHFNNQDVWVIAHRFPVAGTQEFLAYKVTAAGITTTPVTSTLAALPSITGGGYLKASALGDKLAACFTDRGLQLFDFDTKTGTVSNPQTLHNQNRPNFNSYYGAEFSPDGQKLYLSVKDQITNMQLWQFNLAAGSLSNIINTKTILNNMTVIGGTGGYYALQLAKNGKIYVTRSGTPQLSEIASPNTNGMGCNFKTATVIPTNSLAMGSMHNFGFPNFIQSYFAPSRFTYTGICAESPTVFTIVNTTGFDSVRWDFGDPSLVFPNKSTQLQPSHTYRQPGTYDVKLIVHSQGFSSVYERQVTILNNPQVYLGPDTVICEKSTYALVNKYPHSPFNERYRWSTGDTTASISINKAGTYWLELNNGVCTTRDSIVITTKPVPEVDLGPDFFTCSAASVTIDAGNPGATYLWQPGGQTTQTITVTETGAYKVTVTANGCPTTATKNVTIMGLPGMDLGPDITACVGEVITLKSGLSPAANTTFSWSDGSQGYEMQVTKSGKYWATISRASCSYTDTVNVTFKYCPPVPPPFIPNIITPNADNLNDKLESKDLPEGNYTVRIYNRWGIKVFEKKNYRNEWPEPKITHGTYFYIFENEQTSKQFKGWVEVAE